MAAIWVLSTMVDYSEMVQALKEMKPLWLIPSALVYLANFVLRAVRWHYLMRPVAKVKFMPLFRAVMLGFLGNNLLPAHLGEVVRAMALGKSEGVSKSAVFATIVLERVYDGLTVLLFLLMVLLFFNLPENGAGESIITLSSLRTAGWLGLAFFGGLLVILQLFRFHSEKACSLVGYCLKPAPAKLSEKVLGMLESFNHGLSLARGRDLVWTGVYSVLVWVTLSIWPWATFPAFGLDLGIMAGIFMQVVMALAMLIPTAPAFIGVFHLAAAATLSFMGVDGGKAGSFAMVLWLVHMAVTSSIGLYFAWRHGFSMFSLSKSNREETA